MRGSGSGSGSSSSSSSSNTRWCPTPEQLMVLEELYRRGLRTPTAPQIQKITAHLSLYGKIQGKNVFYWFQNHKARDRQKLRKKLQLHQHLLHHHHHPYHFHFQTTSPQNNTNILFQGEEVLPLPGVMRQQQTWRRSDPDPPRDCLMRSTYGHDSVMIMEVGPTSTTTTFPFQFQPPLQTLELFPLTSPTAADLHQS